MNPYQTVATGAQQELDRLHKEKKDCIARAKHIDIEHDRTWNQEILNLAQIIEEEYIIVGTTFLIENISEDISRIYKENNIRIWPYVYEYLPPKYKNDNLKRIGNQNGNWRGSTPELLEQSSTKVNPLNALMQILDNLKKESIAELHHISKQLKAECEIKAKLENIALFPDETSSLADQINTDRERNRTHVTIDRPQPHGSLTYEALGDVIERLKRLRDRVFEFPPEILDKDKEIAESWKIWSIWMEPALDLKYSKCWLDWFKAEEYRDLYGKHAAGVLSFSVSNLCPYCSNEKTKYWVRMEPANQGQGWQCPECDGTTPMRRNLTREQIGDKSSIVVDAAIEMFNHIPAQIAFCQWYRDWVDPRVAGRKIRLKGDLSDKA